MTGKPHVAILSSFNIQHFDKPKYLWRDSANFPFVEMYAFMHDCVEELFGDTTGESALQILLKASKVEGESSRVAEKINAHFSDYKIVAIASYLPEITSPETSGLWQDAQEALKFLVKITSELRDIHHHPCNTLVMAGGSRFDGLWGGFDKFGTKIPVVNILSQDHAVRRLLNRITPVAKFANQNQVRLALSMEPGPLFTLGNWDSLLSFSDLLDVQPPEVRRAIGLNLDIAHWSILSKISVEMIKETPAVRDKIIHAHIADHDRGHCADSVLGSFHLADFFIPWLRFLSDLPTEADTDHPDRLPYTGFVSCELEAARCLSEVELAARTAKSLTASY